MVRLGDARRGLAFGIVESIAFFAGSVGGRNSTRHRSGFVDAGEGLAGIGGVGVDCAVLADPMECGWHHLANLRPRGHRLDGRCLAKVGHRLQLHRQCNSRLADGAVDGRMALDAAGGATVLRRFAQHSGCLLSSGADRRRQRICGVSIYSVAQDARCADDRGVTAIHGQLHDLHRALCVDWWRPR